MTKQSYVARADGWVAGRPVAKGEVINLSPAQAKYEPVDQIELALSVSDAGLDAVAIRLADAAVAPIAAEPTPTDTKPSARRKGGK